MGIGHQLERAMRMSDATWARHANPLSVWTRVPVLPVLLVCLYSYWWIGIWFLLPSALVCIWIWVNPRAFPPPADTDNWASRATFGERVWLNKADIAIPGHHARAATFLSVVSGIGLVPIVYGLVTQNAWAAALGGAISTLGKIWFCDRMVWLYADMIDADPTYRNWLRTATASPDMQTG